ncbi:response regulator transcription factor [Anaerosacchariphilus polymeriproducens]|uniref:Stage 0 sporulation protein A homolog n=1 Tax=Anaerosacchariphilus polymeriproducens TaxID=1812858 RepID=A0A371AZ55_9FIRM|nr:response regulator transcription factor [Anaerosacchariphilus polymeriproducens]RDU24874.1 DNA-binding response regulator [Anaerosacchariphilus polymeriproducens]
MQYKILVVDDEEEICNAIKEYLNIVGYIVYTANNGKEAMERLSILPDLILLDINMPGMDGLDVCKRIRTHVNVPILFLTAKIEEQDRINGLMAGADDYIIKPFALEELHARIVAHLRREERGKGKKNIMGIGDFIINYSERKLFVGEKEIFLTKTEFEIVELLSRHKGQVFDKETIYEKIWGFDKEGDSAIIMEHVRRIRSKFSKEWKGEVIETVWGVGYRWV